VAACFDLGSSSSDDVDLPMAGSNLKLSGTCFALDESEPEQEPLEDLVEEPIWPSNAKWPDTGKILEIVILD
jgi:hypothetical protein